MTWVIGEGTSAKYLTEGDPRLQHFAEITTNLAKAEKGQR
jgi:hypothetical protein